MTEVGRQKAYQAPRLEVLGTVAELTKTGQTTRLDDFAFDGSQTPEGGPPGGEIPGDPPGPP